VKLNVRSWGTGDKVALLIHGLFSDSRCWHRLGPALADRGYRVLAPDLRGHGESGRGRYSIVDWSLDLTDTIGQAPEVAIGHSLGGLVLGVAVKPLGAGRAVYLDPAWKSAPEHSSRSLHLWSTWLEWTNPDQLREVLGQKWPEEDLRYRWESMQLADPAIVPGLATPGGYDASPEEATVPSLVISADGSEWVTNPAELADRGFEVQTIPGSGHSYFREDFDGFLAVLDDWLTRTHR
jgi:pimeloyl-ACP methyl ester carboxylesterase